MPGKRLLYNRVPAPALALRTHFMFICICVVVCLCMSTMGRGGGAVLVSVEAGGFIHPIPSCRTGSQTWEPGAQLQSSRTISPAPGFFKIHFGRLVKVEKQLKGARLSDSRDCCCLAAKPHFLSPFQLLRSKTTSRNQRASLLKTVMPSRPLPSSLCPPKQRRERPPLEKGLLTAAIQVRVKHGGRGPALPSTGAGSLCTRTCIPSKVTHRIDARPLWRWVL